MDNSQKITFYTAWHYAYVYYRHPHLQLSTSDGVKVNRMLRETDFDSDEARAYKAGWMAHAEHLRHELRRINHMNDKDDWEGY